jgi:glycosyltransferase involved in cell wall biosynthesis
MAKKKIAFIRMWSSPPVASSIEQLLVTHFPEYQIDILDIQKLLERRLGISLVNSFFVFKQYGYDILLGRKKFKNCYLRTPYFFKKVKSIVSTQLSKNDYAFSFQLQSLIDASTPELPHFVYTDHTHLANLEYPSFRRSELFPEGWIRLEKTIYQNATLVFARSSNISRSVIEQYKCEPGKVICVYAGNNVPITDRLLDHRRYYYKNILFVGRDWERKGGPDLVEAFKIVLSFHPDAHLTIVGCSPKIDVPNCTVTGPVPLSQVSKYYEMASIFCLPTKREPFGIAFVEAQTFKLPVVATAIGAIPDFVIDQQNGFLVQPNDVKGLALALIKLINDPEKCRTFGENGFRLVKERYTWDKVGTRIREHIQPYLSRNRTKNGSTNA